VPNRIPEKSSNPTDVGAKPLYRRIQWTPLLISVAVLFAGVFAVPPVRDAVTTADVSEAHLVRPLGYVVLAPLSNVFDTLTLLSLRQHIALFVGLAVLFALWRSVRAWRGRTTRRRHVIATAVFVSSFALVYAAGTLIPRPMAALVADDANILIADFHSHTTASHDGHQSVEALRRWHERAGYNVVYVTDHASVAGAERGIANNPTPAGVGVTLLQGIEVTWNGEHVAILGAQRTYNGLLTSNLRDVDEHALRLASTLGGREPVVIWNHPHQLNRLPLATGPGTAGVRAIELVNGAPDDIDEIRRNRREIIALAQGNNLALTAGSDNHGWGYAAPGWTLLRIFGWRGMTGDALDIRIERALREAGAGATRVVERRVADPGDSKLALAFTVFAAPARMLTTISTDERIAWLIWTWLMAAAVWMWRRRRVAP
jgi:hypothetical protein